MKFPSTAITPLDPSKKLGQIITVTGQKTAQLHLLKPLVMSNFRQDKESAMHGEDGA